MTKNEEDMIINEIFETDPLMKVSKMVMKVSEKLGYESKSAQVKAQKDGILGTKIAVKQFKFVMEIITNNLHDIGIEIKTEDYDGAIIKKFSNNNVYQGDKSGQCHIEVAKYQRDIFPHLESEGYFNPDGEKSKNMYPILKNFFLLQIPIFINLNNLNYLNNSHKNKENLLKECYTTIVCDNRGRVEISSQLDYDGPYFDKLHKSLKENDFLIILKRKEELSYEGYGIKSNDVNDTLTNLNNKFFYSQNKTIITTEDLKRNIIREKLPFTDYLSQKNFNFNKEIIKNFSLSIKTKPFVILTGNSGTGKTKLAQLFANYLYKTNPNYKDKNYEIVPVGANWTDNKNILGFYNVITKEYHETQSFKLIKRALNDQKNPYFLILDEMNLSHVERYFADFLSAMESSESIPLYTKNISEEDFKKYCVEIEEEYSYELNDEDRQRILNEYFAHEKTDIQVISSDCIMSISASIKLPKNLFIIGTVNVDETTYMFSPKVLDRANVIEFETDIEYLTNDNEITKPSLNNEDFLEDILFENDLNLKIKYGTNEKHVKNMNIEDLKNILGTGRANIFEELSKELKKFYYVLKESGFDFGYRTINEILRYMAISWLYENQPTYWDEWEMYFDTQIKQKLLPKLHGSERELKDTLEYLRTLCICGNDIKYDENFLKSLKENSERNIANAKYKESAKKLDKMLKVLEQQKYVSFIN